jgi:hypothetical protein
VATPISAPRSGLVGQISESTRVKNAEATEGRQFAGRQGRWQREHDIEREAGSADGPLYVCNRILRWERADAVPFVGEVWNARCRCHLAAPSRTRRPDSHTPRRIERIAWRNRPPCHAAAPNDLLRRLTRSSSGSLATALERVQ